MPKSKRAKVVHLTKTDKKGTPAKEALQANVKEALKQYLYIYIFRPQNMRNQTIQGIRTKLKPTSKIFMGKLKVMQVALGKHEEQPLFPSLDQIITRLVGDVGLLFTNEKPEVIQKFFEEYHQFNYPKAGFVATKDMIIPEGPLPDIPPAMEPHIRALGMPTILQKGVINLQGTYKICKQGDVLTPEQAKLVKVFGEKMERSGAVLLCKWHDGVFEEFVKTKTDAMETAQ
uniref:Ribosome assembly factor mrt4 n=1 Tax=Arcella intermedia TaxID=1963864 RepID=A0A6B2LHD1_9EUKA|eukprot:TRINITY_DN27165_c0_g1_i1.p1 TRINITY_DN27165_c0_g1~~TRINITY_DN27165_c0_g1_i1.p1  ORF type:complete len:230 (-),score=44.02 TRINITY_DN27165_c0_g1_i1:48-737(-)